MSRDPGDGRQVTGMIGLGLLGSAIARRLLERGLEVIGLDIDPGRAPELGMETADSPAQLAERLGVLHQSPQAILVRDGQAVWNDSHEGVTSAALKDAEGR